MKHVYDPCGVETIPQFLKAARLSVRILRPVAKLNPDGYVSTFYPVTFTRRSGENLKTGAFIESPTHDEIFDYLQLVLGVNDWQRFSCARLKDAMPMKTIGAEWRAYQSLRKPLLRFFCADELRDLSMPFL